MSKHTKIIATPQTLSDFDLGVLVTEGAPSTEQVRAGIANAPSPYSFYMNRPHGQSTLVLDEWDYYLQERPAASVDVVISDPAYWTIEEHRVVGTTTRLGGALKADNRDGNKWFEVIDQDALWRFVCECYRILKPGGIAWIMCDFKTLSYLTGFIEHRTEGHDFKYWKSHPVLKLRGDGQGLRPGMGYHGKSCHEYVVFLQKGKKNTLRSHNWDDVFQYPWTGDAETRPYTPHGEKYPTAKPLAFFRRLIELSTDPGDTVYDGFMGSGTTAVAAWQTGRNFVGTDVNPASIVTTANRLRAMQLTI